MLLEFQIIWLPNLLKPPWILLVSVEGNQFLLENLAIAGEWLQFHHSPQWYLPISTEDSPILHRSDFALSLPTWHIAQKTESNNFEPHAREFSVNCVINSALFS